MDCKQLRAMLSETESLSDPHALEHLENCAACKSLASPDRSLLNALTRFTPQLTIEAQSELFSNLDQELRQTPRWRSALLSLSTKKRWMVSLGSLALLLIPSLAHLRSDLGAYPHWRLVVELLLFLGALGAALWFWFRPLYRPAIPRWLGSTIIILGTAIPFLVFVGGHLLSHQSLGMHHSFRQEFRGALPCFTYGSLFAAAFAGLSLLISRGERRTLGWMLGPVVAGGLIGVVGLHLHCPGRDLWHLIIGHSLILPILVLLGSLILYLRGMIRR